MPQSDGLREGEVFAGYTIIRRLGAGGMGQVYLAQHPRLPRRDALKVLPGDVSANLEFRQRFNREADLAASLYHEHIVGIHDRGEYEGQLWISMDYVEGTDAARLLRSEHPSGMPRADVVEIIWAVADALDHAHSRGLLHRDIKPANILLGDASPRRRILLADFGIARELGEISGLTATNMTMGTTAYCAPEQLQGDDLDARADQYALGCTAFHLLTGGAPFQHSNPAVVITHHLSAPPPSVSERRPELADLDAVIAKAMAKDPDERYATCADFASALAGKPITGSPGTSGPTEIMSGPTQVIAAPKAASEKSAQTRGSRLGPAALIAALVTVVLAAVAVVVGVRMLGAHTNQQASSQQTSGAPSSSAAPPSSNAAPPSAPAIKLSNQITDESGVLTPIQHAAVERAVNKLYNERGTHLWVVYVKNFGGLLPMRWAENTMRANAFGDTDAILGVATDVRGLTFRVPDTVSKGKVNEVETIRRDRIRPAVERREWALAAIEAANGLDGLTD
jgi:serine/threonine protein kinase